MGVTEDFLATLTPHTASGYRRDLNRLAAYLDASVAQAVGRLLRAGQASANEIARGFQQHLLDEGHSVPVTNRAVAALRTLVRWGRETGRTKAEIHVDHIRLENGRDKPELIAMQQVFDYHRRQPDSVKDLRDVALLALLILGLRRGEVAGLNVAHVDLEGMELSVLRERRTKRERVALSADATVALRAWLDVHEGYEPLLYSLSPRGRGGRLAGNSIWEATKRLGEKCGVKLWPRGMRRTVAVANRAQF